jgi:putative membrane protein
MVRFILRALVSALGFWLAAKVVPGVHVDGWETLVLAGLILGVVNAIVRPILTFFTLPLTIVTLGLFLLVINGLMVKIVDWLLTGLRIEGFVAAILTTVVIWLTSLVANAVFGGELSRRRED